MAELEKLLNELPTLVKGLKLTVTDADQIQQEITRLNDIQEKLQNLQVAIAQELDVTKSDHAAVSAISLSTARTVFIREDFSADKLIVNGEGFIAEKFGNFNQKLSLTDLQSQIARWYEWGELLQSIVGDILNDSQIITELNCNINYPSIPDKFQEIEQIIPINLAFGNSQKLQQQMQQIHSYQEELLQMQQRLTVVFDNIKSSQNILVTLLGLSLFYGQSGLELQWFADDYGFIISSVGKFQPLAEVINECEIFKHKIDALLADINSLQIQAKEAIVNVAQDHPLGKAAKYLARKKINSVFLISSSLVVLGFGGWTINHQIHQVHPGNLTAKQQGSPVDKFKSAQKLGLEAALIVQKPPLPLKDWQQAESKWQQAVKLLESIPEGTSISSQANKQLISYRANYSAISKRVLTEKNAATNLESAQKLAVEAAFIVKNAPPESVVLQQAKDKWQEAINLLQSIPEGTFVSKEVQDKLTSYKNNYEAMSKN